MRLALVAAITTLCAGCCHPTRTYVEPVGPMQAMTMHTHDVVEPDPGRVQPAAPRMLVTRHYHGPRPSWWDFGREYYLPEPTIVRACTGTLIVTEHVWGYPPPKVLPNTGATTHVIDDLALPAAEGE